MMITTQMMNLTTPARRKPRGSSLRVRIRNSEARAAHSWLQNLPSAVETTHAAQTGLWHASHRAAAGRSECVTHISSRPRVVSAMPASPLRRPYWDALNRNVRRPPSTGRSAMRSRIVTGGIVLVKRIVGGKLMAQLRGGGLARGDLMLAAWRSASLRRRRCVGQECPTYTDTGVRHLPANCSWVIPANFVGLNRFDKGDCGGQNPPVDGRLCGEFRAVCFRASGV